MSQPSMLERLKQSAVVQAVALFLGASWVVLQVVDLMTERLGLPDWVFPVALILLGIGLVVVLATAWVQSRAETTAAEEAGEIPTDWEVAPADAIASLKAGKLPHLTWGRAIMGGVVSLSLLFGFAGAFVLFTGGAPSLGPQEAGADEAATGIAVLPFSVNNDAFAEWEEGVMDLLAPGLDGVAGYRSIPSRTVLSRWEEMIGDAVPDLDASLDVAGRTGARYAITGNVVALGPTVRVTAEVYDLADGAKVADGSAEGPVDDVLRVVDEVGLDVMRNLMTAVGGEGIDQDVPARLTTTTSLAAARAFLEGEAHYRGGRFREAVASYTESMNADSTFGLPVLRASWALLYEGEPDAREAMDRRLEGVLDHLSPRDRSAAVLRLQVNGDSLRTAGPAEQAVQRYPDDPEAWYLLGEVRFHEPGLAGGGHPAAREAFEKALELAPDFVPYYYHVLDFRMGYGEEDGARELLDRLAEAVGTSDPQVGQYEMMFPLVFGDLAEAQDMVRQNAGLSVGVTRNIPISTVNLPRFYDLMSVVPAEGDLFFTDQMSSLAMAIGLEAEAMELWSQLPLGSAPRVTLARHHQDVLGALPSIDGDVEYALSNCGDPGSRREVSCHEKAALHAVDAGRVDDARRAIQVQDSIAQSLEDDPLGRSIHHRIARTIEGYIAWKAGDLDEAIANLQEARRQDEFAVSARWYLAEMYAEASNPNGAADLFLSIDDSPTWSPFSRLRAAEIYEGTGDLERAATHYNAALAAWVRADPDFGPKARAEAGLARVGG